MPKVIKLQVISVSPVQHVPTERGGYNVLEIAFKDIEKGKVEGKKLVDFSNPELFKRATSLEPGARIAVTIEKEAGRDGREFWQWKDISTAPEGDAGPVTSAPQGKAVGTGAVGTAGRVTGSNYETPAERAQRQVLIVRQSSVTAALKYVEQTGQDASLAEILDIAEQLKEYVYNGIAKAEGSAKEADSNPQVPQQAKEGAVRKAKPAAKKQAESIDEIEDDMPF